ncbi:hypothetical protein O6H91_10G057400 [Diphasiastrum complanatum]|uniref:Uncharacterized protein n=1 Tax=Diphasiastrum complanatum TaxID=34168 RepID=A0ACC2CHH3_DIPCM|nr:hypothetical protein O6H91_10G057400 [Diphasiastrum complanatum]
MAMAVSVSSLAFSHLSISCSSSPFRFPSSSSSSSSQLSCSASFTSSQFLGTSMHGNTLRPSVFSLGRPSLVKVLAATTTTTTKKADSAAKRARQAEKRHIYNKSRKSEIRTRMKKVFLALDGLKKRTDAAAEDIKPVEVLIGEAYSVIDKAVKVGTIHRNTGNHRKSRLARAKKTLETQLGWYTPVAAVSQV